MPDQFQEGYRDNVELPFLERQENERLETLQADTN